LEAFLSKYPNQPARSLRWIFSAAGFYLASMSSFIPHILNSPHGEILLLPYAAHLLSWKTADGKERLYLSSAAVRASGKAIRGGVPLIFPQFGGAGPLRHGFARTLDWTLTNETDTSLTYSLKDSPETLARWPHPFVLEYQVALLANALELTFNITNSGATPFACTAALHTYLAVTSLEETCLTGLTGARYLDEVTMQHHEDTEAEIRFGAELDRVYESAGDRVVRAATGQGILEISSTQFPDVVVWNPGTDMADLPPGGWDQFICVEAAAFTPITIEPLQTWQGSQTLRLIE
jgi:glucose-6-phosphate 1-epimerase